MYNREGIIECAKKDIGLKESPAGSNKIKYNDWYYEGVVINAAWCATAVSYWYYYGSGWTLPYIDTENGFGYVPTLYIKGKKLKVDTINPKPADIITFDFNLDGKIDHTGIFESWIEEGKTFWSIEGNTTADGKTGSQSNGGEVCRKKRTVNKGVTFFNIIDNIDKFPIKVLTKPN